VGPDGAGTPQAPDAPPPRRRRGEPLSAGQRARRAEELSRLPASSLRRLVDGGCPLPFDHDCAPDPSAPDVKRGQGFRADPLSVRPERGAAVLFYSQRPDGRLDWTSRHSGCPVWRVRKEGAETREEGAETCDAGGPLLSAADRGCDPDGDGVVKYGANVWVWNSASYMESTMLELIFENARTQTVSLFYGERGAADAHAQPSHRVRPGGRASQASYPGHLWRAEEAGGREVGRIVITEAMVSRASEGGGVYLTRRTLVVRIDGTGMHAA
jgi:hypothetical protein